MEEIEGEIGAEKSGKHTGFNRGFLVVSNKKDLWTARANLRRAFIDLWAFSLRKRQ